MKTKQSKCVPELRFPGFVGAWETRTLRDFGIAVIDGDRGKNYPNGDDFTPEGFCIFLNAKNVTKSGFDFREVIFISDEKNKSLSKGELAPDDVVLTTRGTVGNIALFDSSVAYTHLRINSGMVLLRATNSQLSPRFLNSAFFAPPLDCEVKKTAFGSAQPQLTVKGIYALKFGAPTLPEQQKIADFLTAVDGRIGQLIQKKALLEDYKKGVMQQLFTQAIRFKDKVNCEARENALGCDHGNDFPDWEEKNLGEIGSFKSGVGFSESEQGGKEGTPFYKVSDMNLSGNESVMKSANHYVTKAQINDNKYKVVSEKFILFAKVGAAIFLERKRIATNFLIDNNMMAFTPSFDLEFAKHLFATIRLSKFAQVGALPSYNASDLKTIRVSIPSTPEEQTKIADFLSAIDRKIASVATQITETQTLKRGLLQQMFV